MSPDDAFSSTAAEVLSRFGPATRAWFTGAFEAPTDAQLGAWKAISGGRHTLVVAPTGSGKTLSAFLWALDRLSSTPRDPEKPRCRVLYVSPLKALAVDVERNLRSPLVGIAQAARRLGLPAPDVSVALRSGDTPASERRAFARSGADVLITTPESLFLLLTSAAREALAGIETVIVDEVHAVAGTKRGAHLAVSLDRLDALLSAPAQRVGLSATVRPVEEVARFLAGGRPVDVVQPPAQKRWDLRVEVPVPDMTDPGATEAQAAGGEAPGQRVAGEPERLDVFSGFETPLPGGTVHETVTSQEPSGPHPPAEPGETPEPTAAKQPAVADGVGEMGRPDASGQPAAADGSGATGHPDPAVHPASADGSGATGLQDKAGDDAGEALGQGPVLPDLDDDDDLAQWLPPADPTERASIWPHVERRILQLVGEQTSTLVFANSRRLAERLTSRLNEEWQDLQEAQAFATDAETDDDAESGGTDPAGGNGRNGRNGQTHPADPSGRAASAPRRPPAQVMAQAGASRGAPGVLARAHHGSVSKEQRAEIEEALKGGLLPAVVATSSLELGIDMGAVDLVVQVESPPSVASGLQRVGRAGHQVGAVSHGVFLPKHRGDLVQSAVVVDRMRQGLIESLSVPSNPLDVLAQQIVAMVAMDDWSVTDLLELVRRGASFAALPRPLLEATLDMLSGRYPSEDFADLRPRLVWDRITDTLSARRGSQHLAVMSGGTIPDRGLYAVMLATGDGPGRRVGELDEEMVYESRVGDVFTLGTTSWRIEDITHDRVLVTPAPGQVGKLPFWKGDSLGRPAELGKAVGAFVRTTSAAASTASGRTDARASLAELGLDRYATDNLLDYFQGQQEATGRLPDDRTIVVERFRDEIGDWRVVVHSPFGTPVHAPWALCLAARMRERYGTEVQAMAADDGIVLRLPDLDLDDGGTAALDRDLAELLVLDPDEVHDMVTTEIGGSALFAARFRECAARALLLPRRGRPDRRQPLWQQRQRSAQLLEVAARYPSFPIVLEAVRECVQDVYDVDALTALMRDLASRSVQLVTVETSSPSPFARSLLLGYVAQFLYEGDSPLAERRAAALSLDPSLLAELLGRGEGAALRDLLDPEVVARTEAELQRLVPERACRDRHDMVDLLRSLGPQSEAEIAERTVPEVREHVATWLGELSDQRQVVRVRIGGADRYADAQDAGRLRDALGVALPTGVPLAYLEPVDDPLGDLVVRWSRTHTPYRLADLAARLDVGQAVVRDATRRLVASGRLVEGQLRPLGAGETDDGTLDLCDAEVLRMLRRRSLAALRQEVEPVTERVYAAFLPAWQGIGVERGALRGVDGVLRAVEQLAGARLPASALESLVLPARVRDYSAAMLDELMTAGEVLWQGHGSLPGDDGWISLHVAETAGLTLAAPEPLEDAAALGLLSRLDSGGAWMFRALSDAVGSTDDTALTAALWELVWSGRAAADTLAPVRALLSGGRTAHKARRSSVRSTRWARGGVTLAARPGRPTLPSRSGPPATTGRWSLLPEADSDPTARALATAEQLLDRYGVLTRGSVVAEGIEGGYAGVYRVLATAEEAGRVRRGYFVEHLGAAQFGTTGAVDRLRALGTQQGQPPSSDAPPEVLVLAATDPANPYGASVPWPDPPAESDTGHRPARKAGALVALRDGELVTYLERGGRTALTYTDDAAALGGAGGALAALVRSGRLASLTVTKIDGGSALGGGSGLATALVEAGFHTSPQGLRLRR